jgi:hypothetical protein
MQRRQKKGLTTILAVTFVVILIVVGLGVMTSSLVLQNNLGQVVTQKYADDIEKVNERIEIREGWVDNNKLSVTVVNTGPLPVKLVRMWVTNMTATSGWHQSYDLDKVINPADSWKGMGTALPLTANNASSYKISVITERGSSANFQIFSAKDRAVQMSLFASPRSIPTGQDVTLLFGVTNNLTDGIILHSLTPKLNWTKVEAPTGTITAAVTLVSGPTPTVEQSLTPAETVFFKWVYNIAGDPGDRVDFLATLVNAKQGNYVTESATVVIDSFAEQSNISFQVLGQGTQSGFLVKKDNFTKITTTGSQSVTVGFQPKAVVFFWTRQSVEGLASGIQTGYGFASSPSNERGIAIASRDGQGTSQTARSQSQTYSIIILSDTSTINVVARAEVTSFTSTGFTLNWQLNENRQDIIHYIALGGSDLTNAIAGSFTATTSPIPGSQSIGGVGFKPDFLMFLSIDEVSYDTSPAIGKSSIGFASSPTEEASIAVTLENGQGTSDSWVRQRTDSSLNELSNTGADDMLADITSFDTDGFTIYKSSADQTDIHYLALKGGKYKVGSFSKSPSTAVPVNQNVTGIGFKPSGLILASKNLPSNTNMESEGRISFGASDGIKEGATWFHDKDNLGTSDANQRTSNSKIAIHGNQATLNAEADLTSFNADGFALNWTTNNGVAEQIVYAALGNATTTNLIVSSPDVKVNMTNTGTNTIWVDKNARVVFNNTATSAVYAGLVQSWKNFTSGATGAINSTLHSDAWEPNTTLELLFSWPRVIPGDSSSGTIVSGQQYNVYVRLTGYDERGQFVLKTIPVGTAQVT